MEAVVEALLDARSPVPLYAQIADHLRRALGAGDPAAGQRFPSEHALADRFRVGRPTIRQALETLSREGLIERRRGAGTFVSGEPPKVDLFGLEGTLATFSRSGVALTLTITAGPRLTADGGYRVERAGHQGAEPVLLESLWFDARVFPGFDALPLAGRSLAETVANHYCRRPTAAEVSFRAIALAEPLASALALSPGAPALTIERVLLFPGAGAAVRSTLTCRTDRVVLTQRIGGSHA